MVLQDAGDTSSDSFSDSQYPGDGIESSSTSESRIDTTQLPRPLPIPLMGFSESTVRWRTETTIKYAERRIKRPMTIEEQQALATSLWKMEQTKSYFALLGMGLGGWRAYQTMGSNRYPFYLPKPESVDPNKFVFVKGPMAYYARHSVRFLAYTLVAGQVAKIIGQAYAQPLAARSTANDPRLAQFAQDLKASIEGDMFKGRQGRDRTEGVSHDESELRRRERADRAERWGIGMKKTSQTPTSPSEPSVPGSTTGSSMDDDMSPTSGNDPWSQAPSASWGDVGLSDAKQNRSSSPPQQTTPRSTRNWNRGPPSRVEEDDMSPTGGLFQDDVQDQSKPEGSAWDRLRRGQGPSSSQRPASRTPGVPHREQREGSTIGDNFTFADSDEDRKRAQERAQREFNARLERERQGRDFNSDEKRW